MLKCYIYALKNTINGKRYIGSSKYLLKRLKRHYQSLSLGNHHSIKLQRAYDLVGKQAFITEILEEFDFQNNNHIFEKEQYYIDLYNTYKEGYNCTKQAKNGGLFEWSKELKEKVGAKISKLHKGKVPKNFETMQKVRWKPVYEIRDGVVVNEYPSVRQAGLALGIDYKSIHAALKCKQERKKNSKGIKRERLPNLKNRKDPSLDWEYK